MMPFIQNITPPLSAYEVGSEYSIPQNRYKTYRAGILMHMMPDDRVNYSRYDIESYLTVNYDWAGLAAQIASIGHIDFVLFRVKIEDGFAYWPTSVEFNNGNSFLYNGVTVPQYGADYHIGNSYYSGLGITSDMVERFFTAFEPYGIETGFYYPIGRDRRTRTDLSITELRESNDPAIYGSYDIFHQQVIDEIDELMRLYKPGIMWLDSVLKHPWKDNSGNDVRYANQLEIYNTIKSNNRNCIVGSNLNVANEGRSFYNETDPTKLQFFPLDIIGSEKSGEPTNEAEWAESMSHDGDTYVIPKENLYDGFYNDSTSEQYVYWDTNAPDAPTNANTLRTQQDFQDAQDLAVTRGATMLWNVGPIPASVGSNIHKVDATYLSRLQNIVL